MFNLLNILFIYHRKADAAHEEIMRKWKHIIEQSEETARTMREVQLQTEAVRSNFIMHTCASCARFAAISVPFAAAFMCSIHCFHVLDLLHSCARFAAFMCSIRCSFSSVRSFYVLVFHVLDSLHSCARLPHSCAHSCCACMY